MKRDGANVPGENPRGSWIKRLWLSKPWLAIGLAVLLALAVGLGAFGINASLEGGRSARKLSQATELIEQADKSVVEIDSVIGQEMSAELAEPAEAAARKVEGAAGQLKKALALVRSATPGLREGDQQRAQLLTAAAQGRLDMLAQAPAILAANEKSANALPKALTAWAKAVEAKTDSDKAVAQYNKLTVAGVKASSALNKTAGGKLAAARREFVEAEDAFPEADFEAYIAYVDIRIELNALSQQSDKAWLDEDTARANVRIEEYNDKDVQSVNMASALPATPTDAVAAAYEASVGRSVDEYYAARSRATKADAQLK